MNDLRKVLVVDGGRRGGVVDPLSAELAELGFSSVTTSFEAADQVLDMIERPSAIFLNIPSSLPADRQSFLDLADQFRAGQKTAGVPVIVWNDVMAGQAGGVSALLQRECGSQVPCPPRAASAAL